MLSIAVIGLGNAGSQVAALAKERLAVDVLAINSSENDLQTIPNSVPKRIIGDQKGAGKERKAAKIFLKESITKLLSDEEVRGILSDKDVIFIVSSTGGGTGSGIAVIMANTISKFCSSSNIIIVGILPTLKEALSTQINSIEYLQELYEKLDGATYMLYDNDKLSKLSSIQMMNTINQTIVDDMNVIRGIYQIPTKFSSIDEKDMSNIISTSGRIVISSINDLKEKDIDDKSIEDILIEQFKTNAHCEIQRDGIVKRTGVIINASEKINNMFDSHIPKVQAFIGSPVEEFEHIAINQDRHLQNCVFLIAAGLTQINDRINKINDRIEEINDLQNRQEEDNELHTVDIQSQQDKIERRKESDDSKQLDLGEIFDKFDI